ncbi:uncharacterized protein LOC126975380 isoform X2 [Leptidea sinapis]|nr:uncharacterized protein LOC126975380 isoform X2 [Leptidea sinapis]
MQTLGAETIVDAWLFSTPEMLEFEYKEAEPKAQSEPKEETEESQPDIDQQMIAQSNDNIKQEPTETETKNESWLDFFTNDATVNVDDMLVKDIKTEKIDNVISEFNTEELPSNITQPWKKRIMKYIEPNTGKIYYLEMDRKLDLSTVQEIVINSKGNVKTAKISPIKNNGVKSVKNASLLRPLQKEQEIPRLPKHIENDHCYIHSDYYYKSNLDIIKENLCKFTSVRRVVSYLLKRIPLISDQVSDKCYPFVVESDDKYWKLDFAKRRNIEWSRAKLINKLLLEKFGDPDQIWRTKQILIFSRLHGYYAIRPETSNAAEDWSIENRRMELTIKQMYPRAEDISTFTEFNLETFKDMSTESTVVLDSDEEIDVVGDSKVSVVKVAERGTELSVLGVECEETRLQYMFLERTCAEVGVELRNEDVGCGYSYSAVHAVLLSALRSFAEEVVRGARAASLRDQFADQPPPTWLGTSRRVTVGLEHVYEALTSSPELEHLTNSGLASKHKQTHSI